jgi:dTDP-4-dehydrorhamnose reductase
MKILVLGASGMAGHVVSIYLKKSGYEVDTISLNNKIFEDTVLLDISNLTELNKFLDLKEYDVIVNCAGILIEQSEVRKDLSIIINAYLPKMLENKYLNKKTKIIHLSTDCVFSGKNGPYSEDSEPDGNLFYDKTKLLGEINNEKDLTFRMSIIGPDIKSQGVGLFNWFTKQQSNINGYVFVNWNGITTICLSKAIDKAIKENLSGLYHLVPETSITKFNLLKLFKKYFGGAEVVEHHTSSINKILINNRKDFNFIIPDYDEMIKEMIDWINNYQHLYPHYKKQLYNL